jgi:kynurenine 3-monooxygenase
MMIALPNADKSFTVTLFCRPEQTETNFGFDALKTKEQVDTFFKTYFSDVYPKYMPTLMDDFFGKNATPYCGLCTVKCYPYHYNRNTILIGDAAHAVVPFFGQGVNCGFEDVFVLNQLLDKNCDDFEKTLKEYTQARHPNGGKQSRKSSTI